MTRWETSKYTDPRPDHTADMFTFAQQAKSIITTPAHPGRLEARGWHSVNGLAWTGRGRITKVEVSTDGVNWLVAQANTGLTTQGNARGLVNGQNYQFRVSAITAAGYGHPADLRNSSASVPVPPD